MDVRRLSEYLIAYFFLALGVDLQFEQVGALVPEVDVAKGFNVNEKLLHCSERHYSNLLLSLQLTSISNDEGSVGNERVREGKG